MPPVYEFKALTQSGQTQRGIIEAENQRAARMKLRRQNLTVTDIIEKSLSGGSVTHSNSSGRTKSSSLSIPFFSGRVASRDIALTTRQLASLIKSRIPLVEALTAMVDQTEHPTLKLVIAQVRQDVNEGASLAKALQKHPRIFDHIFVNMVEAGESSGTLALVLLKLADLKEAQMRLRGKIISGMTYPVLMLFVALGLLIAIFTFVIPKLAKVFESMNKPMPASTQFLMATSDFLINWWFFIFPALFFAAWMLKRYLESETGRPRWDRFKLRVPIFGDLVRMIAVTRFSGTMATLLSSGVPILTSMNIAKNLVGNIPIANAIGAARENITEGQSIAEPLKKSGQFPPMVIHMISIGEKTGELSGMLKNVSEIYEEQVTAKIQGLTALLEPLMIIGMGAGVGFIVMSIFVPLLDISNLG